ncbi:MAG TPA: type II toxin-antitoxin system RatA family toxin [Steroidobacteraceae bacterium]|nr:type II toxin-antitoxin system RatA family toxin [Steroidobacteraceae bacterium]
MRHVKRSALVALPPGRLYALINDIDSYPSFLPWCTAARVDSRTASQIVATVAVRRGGLAAQFTTCNELTPERRVHMRLVRGPFRELEGDWLLTPVSLPAAAVAGGAGAGRVAAGGSGVVVGAAPGAPEGTGGTDAAGTRIELSLRFAFANRLTAMVFEPLFEETAAQLVDAFVARARELAAGGG